MNASYTKDEVGAEARLLYVLLDAIHAHGRMPASMESRWSEIQERVDSRQDYRAEGALFFELMEELEEDGLLANTWVAPRWQAAKLRVLSVARAE